MFLHAAVKRWRTNSSIYQILIHIPTPTSAHISNLRLHLMLSTAPIINFSSNMPYSQPMQSSSSTIALQPVTSWSILKITTDFILLLVPNYPISNSLSDGPKSLLLQYHCLIILVILYFSKIPLSPMPMSTSLTPTTITVHGEKNV